MTSTENIRQKNGQKKGGKISSTLLRVQWNNLNKLPECKTKSKWMTDSCMSNHWMSGNNSSNEASSSSSLSTWVPSSPVVIIEYFWKAVTMVLSIFFSVFFATLLCYDLYVSYHVAHPSSVASFVANYWSFTYNSGVSATAI